MTSTLAYALAYVRRGLAVVPLHAAVASPAGMRCTCGDVACRSPAKHPRTRSGLKDASKDEGVIRRWFGRADAPPVNIGIVTGADSGVIVLDIDPRHDGDESLSALERDHGALPATWRFLTGGGGEHILFRHPGRIVPNSAGRLGAGLDIRGDGGYIVAPPSRHMSGRDYAISVDHHPGEVALADAPGWLLDMIAPAASPATPARLAADWRGLIGGLVPEGTRNQTIAALAGKLFAHGLEAVVTVRLVMAFNLAHCVPPLEDAEILATCESIAARELQRMRRRG